MRRNMQRGILGAAILLVAIPAAGAAELVEFVDGRYLRVESHTAVGTFMRLDLTASSFLVIPAERVESIQRGGQVVYRSKPTDPVREYASGPAGSMVEPAAAGGALRSRGPWNWDRPAPGVTLTAHTQDRR
jgi:hypothetical protein